MSTGQKNVFSQTIIVAFHLCCLSSSLNHVFIWFLTGRGETKTAAAQEKPAAAAASSTADSPSVTASDEVFLEPTASLMESSNLSK